MNERVERPQSYIGYSRDEKSISSEHTNKRTKKRTSERRILRSGASGVGTGGVGGILLPGGRFARKKAGPAVVAHPEAAETVIAASSPVAWA